MTQYINKAALVAEIEKMKNKAYPNSDWNHGYVTSCEKFLSFINTLEAKEVDFERELSKYVSNGIHRFFPNVDDDYCKMDSVIWQDYVIETAKHFYELGLKAQKGE